MADQPRTVRAEYDLRPAYYDKFQCLAADCRFTCCKGWKITFDKKDYLSLKRQDGSPELNENMKKTLRRLKKGPLSEQFYGEFHLENGGCCPLQRADGLCSLQLEKGPDALPVVCKVFPRAEGYVQSGYFEQSLSPACEGVLELLWNLPEGVDFVSDPLPKEQVKNVNFHDADSIVIRFQDIRSQCIDFLQDRRFPLPQRIFLMGLALKELADGEKDIDLWLAKAQTMAELPEAAQVLRQVDSDRGLPMFLSSNIKVLLGAVNHGSDFADVPRELCEGLGIQFKAGTTRATIPAAPYLTAQARFAENFKDHEYFMENLMVSLFFLMCLPSVDNGEELWKSYVNFCNLYSFYRFMAVMSCREGASGDKDELFRLMVCASRGLIHNGARQARLRDELFQNDSATLAHMAILLYGDQAGNSK